MGQKLGRYRVCFELASGGMATVYLARLHGDAGFEKIVALKCIHPHLARDRHFVEMFLDEAKIASRAAHPHVCQIFDFGEEGGTYYLAMEYIWGEPLARVLQTVLVSGAQLDPRRYRAMVARIVGDACEALHAVHEMRDERGQPLEVVHRDVSPTNLFISFDGVVKLMDFGIARAKHQTHRTATGEIKGNMPYIAPEQVRGAAVDRRADVWSLGVLLWEMLAVQRLFKRGTTVETMYAVLSDPVPRLDAIVEGLPPQYADVVDRSLRRDPAERWPTARDLGLALQQVARQDGGWPSITELAAWMDRLFPDGRERHHQRLALAREVAQGKTMRTSSPRRSPTRWAGWVVGAAGVLLGTAIALGVGQDVDGRTRDAEAPRSTGPAPLAAQADEAAGVPGRTREAGADRTGAHGDPAAPPKGAGDARGGGAAVRDGSAEPPEPAPAAAVDTGAAVDPPPRPGAEERRRARARRQRAATRRRDRARASEPARTGRLNVVTPDGWAIVYRRGRRLGQTPLQLELPVGAHVLTLRPFGRGPARRVRARVEGEGTSRVSVRLGR